MFKTSFKQIVKNTWLFQYKKMQDYKSIRAMCYNKLKDDEKPTRFLLCRKSGTTLKNKVDQLEYMLKKISIRIDGKCLFQSWIDTGIYVYSHYSITDNTSPDYRIILNSSIKDLLGQCDLSEEFGKEEYRFISAVSAYIDRIIQSINNIIDKENDKTKVRNLNISKDFFENMKTMKAFSLEEGLQRIVFWSSLFWQTQHRLVGIGRLDKILDGLKLPDTEEKTVSVIKDFYIAMHKYYPFKSNNLLGDTGQIIILGGREPDGTYFSNQLTYSFIKASIGQKLPDPKLLLRVCSDMPEELLEMSIKCIATGIGYPLLANDDRIIPAIKPIYGDYEAYDYVTSACWEPLVYGKSLDKNNLSGLNFASSFVQTYLNDKFDRCVSKEEIVKLYLECLESELKRVENKINKINWEADPLASLFMSKCLSHNKDISIGGAEYNNYGVLGVGLGNVINSILGISELTFNLKKYTLTELKNACINNYDGYDDVIRHLKSFDYYGTDDEKAISLTKEIVEFVYNYFKQYKNKFGGVLKFGLSASNYKESGDGTKATMDGRKDGEPLGVHISSHGSNAYTGLVNFASQLNYDDIRCNGNVIDFFVSPSFINLNQKKFIYFIKAAIRSGFFQMQMNVIDSKTLQDAKANPGKYPGLVIRVWGFSAYFNDLPMSYKDLLIERAQQSEGIV